MYTKIPLELQEEIDDQWEILLVSTIQAKTQYAQQFRDDVKKLNTHIDEWHRRLQLTKQSISLTIIWILIC